MSEPYVVTIWLGELDFPRGYPLTDFGDPIGNNERRLVLTGESALMMGMMKSAQLNPQCTTADPSTQPITEAGMLADRLEECPDEAPDDELRALLIGWLRSCVTRGRMYPMLRH